ncbi:MAG: lysozyme inhibitor LprI family protein [Deltaproteobacteria bacterium]|jgi:uncharacterized protein|nr:lysozyme inhibitor LprI family protein [Deltaproteobacteria bacterium]
MPRQLFPAALAAALYLAFAPRLAAYEEPSFDCDKAASSVEITICSDSGLAVLDRRMAQLYSRARQSPYVDRGELLADQRRWWRLRESQCGRSRRAVECLVDMYQARIDELRDMVD